MPKCSDCRQQQAKLTFWQKIRTWFFAFFHEDIADLSSDKFTQGFGEGYRKSTEHSEIEKGINASLQRIESSLERFNRQKDTRFDPIDISKVLIMEKRGQDVLLRLNGDLLLPDKVDLLKQEANFLLHSDLWSIMQETVKNDAIKNFLVKGENWEAVLKGQAMLRNLDYLKKIVDTVDSAT